MRRRHLEPWVILGILLSVSCLLSSSLVRSSANETRVLSVGELASDVIELRFSTYLGGIDSDAISAIAIDDNDDIYLVGYTDSSEFPTTEGAYDRSHNGGPTWNPSDCFVMKLSNDGQEIIYSTFIGGGDGEYVTGIVVDEEGNAYIVGVTASHNFPTTVGVYDRTYNGGESDCFVAKLSPTGSELLFSTYIGGSEGDFPHGIALGHNGQCYVVGRTYSEDFPVDTPNEQESCYTLGGDYDGFVFKLVDNGSSLEHSMYLEGMIYDVGIDNEYNIVLVGATSSSDFPLVNATDDELSGASEGFIVRLDSDGSFLISTFFGGSDTDIIKAVNVGPSNQLFLTGSTSSEDFPRVSITDQRLNGTRGVFLSIINTQVTDIEFSCVLKHSSQEGEYTSVGSVVLVSEHEIWLGGITENEEYPTTEDALDTTMVGIKGFLTMIDSVQGTLNYSTFFGGSKWDTLSGLVMDSSRNLISCGSTESPDFPVKNAIEPEKISPEHYSDGFIFSLTTPGSTASTTMSTDTSTTSTIGPDLIPILTFIGISTVAILIVIVIGVKKVK